MLHMRVVHKKSLYDKLNVVASPYSSSLVYKIDAINLGKCILLLVNLFSYTSVDMLHVFDDNLFFN